MKTGIYKVIVTALNSYGTVAQTINMASTFAFLLEKKNMFLSYDLYNAVFYQTAIIYFMTHDNERKK